MFDIISPYIIVNNQFAIDLENNKLNRCSYCLDKNKGLTWYFVDASNQKVHEYANDEAAEEKEKQLIKKTKRYFKLCVPCKNKMIIVISPDSMALTYVPNSYA